jgi:hypothetical protein
MPQRRRLFRLPRVGEERRRETYQVRQGLMLRSVRRPDSEEGSPTTASH